MYLPHSSQNSVSFNWSSPFSLFCPALHYHINASNCGNCSTITNHSTESDSILCTNVQTKASICNFSIWFKFCEVMVGTATSIPLGQRLESSSVLLPALLGMTVVLIIIPIIGVVLFMWFNKRTKMLKFGTFTPQ